MTSTSISRNDFINLIKNKSKPLLVKFSADWCGPCKKIKPTVDKHVGELQEQIIFMEIDIDESIDVYAAMKSKRMLSGIPTILFYAMDNKDFYPSLTTTGGNIDTVNDFFEEISEMV